MMAGPMANMIRLPRRSGRARPASAQRVSEEPPFGGGVEDHETGRIGAEETGGLVLGVQQDEL